MKILLCENARSRLLFPLTTCLWLISISAFHAHESGPEEIPPIDWKFLPLQNESSGWVNSLRVKTIPGVRYTLQESTTLHDWTDLESVYGSGVEWICPLFPGRAPAVQQPGQPVIPNPPTSPATTMFLILEKTTGNAPLVSWLSLDDGTAKRTVLSGVTLDPAWNAFNSGYFDRHGGYFFSLSPRLSPAVEFTETPPAPGPLDAAMLADLTTHFPAITQNISNSVANAALYANQPQPQTEGNKRFFRIHADYEYDATGEGIPDWIQFTIPGHNPFAPPGSGGDGGIGSGGTGGQNDSDGDGLSDADETTGGSNPHKSDTDDDGLSDFDELQLGSNPANPNTDGDSIALDGDDADPADAGVRWKKAPESRYAVLDLNVPALPDSDDEVEYSDYFRLGDGGHVLRVMQEERAGEDLPAIRNFVKAPGAPNWAELPQKTYLVGEGCEIDPDGNVTATGFQSVESVEEPEDTGLIEAVPGCWKLVNGTYQPLELDRTESRYFGILGIRMNYSTTPLYRWPNVNLEHQRFPFGTVANANRYLTEDWFEVHNYWDEPPTATLSIKGGPQLEHLTDTRLEFSAATAGCGAGWFAYHFTQSNYDDDDMDTERAMVVTPAGDKLPGPADGNYLHNLISIDPKLLPGSAPLLVWCDYDKIHIGEHASSLTWKRSAKIPNHAPRHLGAQAPIYHYYAASVLNARGEAFARISQSSPTNPLRFWRNGIWRDLPDYLPSDFEYDYLTFLDTNDSGMALIKVEKDGERKILLLVPTEIRGYVTREQDTTAGVVKGVYVTEKERVLIPDTADHSGSRTEGKTELKIAQWDKVFTPAGFDGWEFDHNKFKRDKDVFRVRLPKTFPPPDGTPEHRVKIWTVDETGAVLDPGAEVDLNVHTDFHETAALCLVADDATDDDHPVEGKADGALGDRTYRAKLGGKVKVQWLTFPGTGEKPVIDIPVPVKKTVTATGFILENSTDAPAANAYFERAKKCLSACGVKLEYSIVVVDPSPTGVNFGTFFEFDLPNFESDIEITMTAESKALMDDARCQPGAGVIPVYFLKNFDEKFSGWANAPFCMAAADAAYGGAIFLDCDKLTESTLAHEFLHILLDASHGEVDPLWYQQHNNWPWCLWHAGGATPPVENGIAARRRILDEMRSRILKSTYCK
ncbi:MAG: hypothetical protein V4733_04150 [Verrucomicrobiota bacterium]